MANNAKDNILLSPLQRIAKASENTDNKMSAVALGVDVLIKGSDNIKSILERQTDVLLDIKTAITDLHNDIKGGKAAGKAGGEKGGFGLGGAAKLGIMVVLAAGAVTLASFIMQGIAPVSVAQLATAILISLALIPLVKAMVEMLMLLSPVRGLGFMAGKFAISKFGGAAGKSALGPGGDEMSKNGAMKMAFMVVLGAAVLITVSSYILSVVKPVELKKLISAAVIGFALQPMAMAFLGVVMALKKGGIGMDKNGAKTIAMSMLVMVAITLAIAGVAGAMAMMPETFIAGPPLDWIFMTGLMLFVFSIPLAIILRSVKGLNLKQMIFAALAIPLIALAIAGVSYAMEGLSGNYVAPPASWTLKAGFALFIFSIPLVMVLRSIKGKTLKEILYASLAVPLLAGTIVAVALMFTFLAKVKAYNAPPAKWTLKVGLAMAVFGIAFYFISKATRGMSIKEIGLAALAMGFIALGILAVAFIFQYLPDEFKTVPVEWSLKTGLAVAIFGLGFMIVVKLMKTFGVGLKDLAMGLVGIVAIGIAVLATAWIFSVLPGSFVPIPIEWTIGAVFAISAFAVPLGVVGLIATSGVGAAALGLGALGMILLAGTIWAVAWIFSKLPDLGAIGKNFTDMLLAPVNGMIDSFVRIKEELGIENLSALGAGLVSIAGGWLALVGALAGQAVGGLLTGVVSGAGKVLDFMTGGLTKTDGPFEVLDKLIRRKKGITSLGPAVAAAGRGFAELSKYQSKGIKALNALLPFSNEWRVKYLRSSATHVGTLAKNYGLLAKQSNKMNVGAINATTKMFDSLRKLAEQDNNPMKVLADDLLKAVAELSTAVDALDKAVARQGKTSGEATSVIGKALNKVKDLVTSNTAEVKKNTPKGGAPKMDFSPVVDAISELEETLTSSGIKVKKNSGW